MNKRTLSLTGGLILTAALAAGVFVYFWLQGRTAQPAPVQASGALKVSVSGPGLYELDSNDLVRAGLKAPDPQKLHLAYRDQEQSFVIEPTPRNPLTSQPGSFKLRFYAGPPDSRYTPDRIYLLSNGNANPLAKIDTGSRLIPHSGDSPQGAPVGAVTDTIHLEQNQVYSPLAPPGAAWFWRTFAAPASQDYPLQTSQLVAGDGLLNLSLWSNTSAPTQPDHRVQIFLNGQTLADKTWTGAGPQQLSTTIPSGLLKDGSNTLKLAFPGNPGVLAEINHLDWIDLLYPRQALANADRLTFEGSQAPLQMGGFSGPVDIYDISGPAGIIQVNLKSLERAPFQGQPGHRYWAVGPQGALHTARVKPVEDQPNLSDQNLEAVELVIAPRSLLAALQPLLEYRRKTGLKVLAVPVEAVYDQFGSGYPEPGAIQELVKIASRWKAPPRSLLLVGDATYDPIGYATPVTGDLLPTFFVQTEFGGETASDIAFGDWNGDGLPELAVGRLPARTADQVATIINKILSYEMQPRPQEWRQHVLAVADGQESFFRTDARAFLDLLPPPTLKDTYFPEAGKASASQDLLNLFDKHPFLVAYFGHGSINMWGKDQLFTNEDVKSLKSNLPLPIVINMTCLTGLFTHPKLTSLAEAFLWQPAGGAVAVLAPTSLTLPVDQSMLSKPLAQSLWDSHNHTLGQAFLIAQRQMPLDSPSVVDVLRTFLLFGDPELSLY